MKTRSFLLGLATATLAACEPEPLPTTGTTEAHDFHSELVADDYVLRVRLPPGYDDGAEPGYPLVLQLDPTFVGLDQLATTTGLVSRMEAEGRVPEAIVVGVDYPDPYTRFRDYSAPNPLDPDYGGEGADLFYATLRDEIVPWVEERFRVDPSRRTLVGHSLGGFVALYAAFRHDPDAPRLLAGVVASDPSFSQDLFTYERWHAERSGDLPVRLYVAIATFNGPVHRLAFDAMGERLESRGYEGLELETDVFETDHGGIIRPSFERGLLHVLAGGEP